MQNNYNFSELARVIEINSYTKNKSGVDKNGSIFRDWMEELGFETVIFKREEIGNHLLFKSDRVDGEKILLLGHLDTVFPEGSFEGFREDDEWIYGAGVCDMKGGNHVALEALRNIKSKFGKIENIDMLLVSDEETGSDDSKYLTADLAKDYNYCFVFEAAGENGEVVVARKGVGTFFLDIEGKASHAGNKYSEGVNANLESAHKLIALTNLTDLNKESTVNVGKKEGGIGANTISPHSKLTFEVRYTTVDERDRLLKGIEDIVTHSFVDGTKAVLSGGIQRDVMEDSNLKVEFIEKLQKITKFSIPTEKRGGVSDANIVSSAGVLTLDGFGPYGDGDHTIYERASKKSFVERIEFVTNILESFMVDKRF